MFGFRQNYNEGRTPCHIQAYLRRTGSQIRVGTKIEATTNVKNKSKRTQTNTKVGNEVIDLLSCVLNVSKLCHVEGAESPNVITNDDIASAS